MIKRIKAVVKKVEVAEVQSISNQGIWIKVDNREFFLPFYEYPWFLEAKIEQIYNLEFFNNKHLHWPELNIDIDIRVLEYPMVQPIKYC